MCGIGNRKNGVFAGLLDAGAVEAYPGSLRLLDALRGRPLAVVSSSKNADRVLRAAGLRDRFDAVVDGETAEREGLRSKPAPDVFARGAELLGVDPGSCAAFEDALSGVASAAAAGIGLVIGVDRVGAAEELRAAGAHLVVGDLAELCADASR